MTQKSPAHSLKHTQLDQKFWKNFASNIWEKKPLFLKNVSSSLLELGEAEIFKLLVLYANRCRKNNDPSGFKFYIDGYKVGAEDVLQVLPEKKDKSLLGYHERMKAMFSDYCLVCDELLTVNMQKQHLLTDFTKELYKHVGFTNRFSEMGLYLGNYRKTPFGVHVDSCGVFSFPVMGKKKFRLWTSEFVKDNPALDRAFKYEKFKKNSQLLEAGPGDMTYWPSSAWHIAESDGSFSATWSLGVWVDKPHQDLFSEGLAELFCEKSGSKGSASTTFFKILHTPLGEVNELPEAYQKSIALLQKLTKAELQEAFLRSWMKHISLQGFKNIPQVNIQVSRQSKIQLRNPNALVLWQHGKVAKKVFLSFGGVQVECLKTSGLFKLVKDINSGKSCLVSSYLKGLQQKQELESLQALAHAGALSAE